MLYERGAGILYLASAKAKILALEFPSYPIQGIQVNAINNSGKIVGFVQSKTNLSQFRAFQWLQGSSVVESSLLEIRDINDSGIFIAQTTAQKPVIWDDATTVPFDFGDHDLINPNLLNNANIVAGTLFNKPDRFDFGYWRKARFEKLVRFPANYAGILQPYSISAAGDVCGYCQDTAHQQFVPCIANYATADVEIIDVSSLRPNANEKWGGTAIGVTSGGVVVGQASGVVVDQNDPSVPFTWYKGKLRRLKFPKSQFALAAVNGAGIICGTYYTFNSQGNADSHAFAFDMASGKFTDLSRLAHALDSDWSTLTYAECINDKNEITGYGTYRGDIAAYYLQL